MSYTPNNSIFTKLQSFSTALSNFELIGVIALDEYAITVHFRNANLDLSLLRQELGALLDCELLIINDTTTGLCSFSIVD